jgi:acyl carrier protein
MPRDYKAEVRQFVESNFLLSPDLTISDSDSFLDLQIIDSTGFLELVGHLEDAYGIKVADDEMVPENLESLLNIEHYLTRKLAGLGQ